MSCNMLLRLCYLFFFLILAACTNDPIEVDENNGNEDNNPPVPDPVSAIESTFQGAIDLDNLYNYAQQGVPNYITKDNTRNNPVTDLGATLGRVLFYDVSLSVDNTIACASCHQQETAFGDVDALSTGVNGITGRHSMRLVNSRFAEEARFFWDERANSLENQTTQPIQDHIEMGFSGQNGDPSLADLILKLSEKDYYQELFTAVYGDAEITEERMQESMAQFIRSIQSFDTKYDQGRANAPNNNANFNNFTAAENRGKRLFMAPPQLQGVTGRTGGGLGCNICHRAPEFDIDPRSRNNGVITNRLDPNQSDFDVTRSPSLRDIFNPQGELNGPLMHDGLFVTIEQVIDHYNEIEGAGNPNLDPRLGRGMMGPGQGGGAGQRLNITMQERADLIAFLKTLSGQNIYFDEKWSNPFQ